jgi:hypothetical protein
MKKNVVGHMATPKESALSRFRQLNILPRLICLLLALVIWLIIVNLDTHEEGRDQTNTLQTEESA